MSKEPLRTSVVKKTIKRTIQTAPYESLTIEDGFEETVEWSTLAERTKKLENWNKLLLESFKLTYNKIIEELGVTEKNAFIKNPSAETIKKITEAQSGLSERKVDLDDLDILR